jgi:hypothetical protein
VSSRDNTHHHRSVRHPTTQRMRSLVKNTRWALLLGLASAFTTLDQHFRTTKTRSTRNVVRLAAIGSLVKKAKQAALRKYVETGVPQNVLDVYNDMMKAVQQHQAASASDGPATTAAAVGPLQESLTKRRGTITVIAEYKRKASEAPTPFLKPFSNQNFTPRSFVNRMHPPWPYWPTNGWVGVITMI